MAEALSRGEHLRTIVDDLITLVRQPGSAAAPVEVGALLGEVRARWDTPLAGRGPDLVLAAQPDLPRCLAPGATVRQILDVLIANALWHGEGTVTIEAHEAGGGVAIEVSDEGPGLPADPAGLLVRTAERDDGHGRGLPLARSLAEAAGGSLEIRRAAPQPVFRLMLPAAAGRSGAQPAAPASKR